MRRFMRVATEDGQAALVRTRAVVSALERSDPGLELHVIIVRRCRPAAAVGFDIAESDGHEAAGMLAAALLEDIADIAVQDLSSTAPAPFQGTTLAAVPRRADPRDIFISRGTKTLDTLPPGSRIGASTPLRCSQVLRMRPDLTPVSVRGPADAHLRRLARGDDGLAAIVVEAARLARKGLLGHAAEALAPERFPPARGQGAVAVLARAGDHATCEALSEIDDPATRVAWEAEWSFASALGADSTSSVGAFASVGDDGDVRLTGAVYSSDGAEEVRGEASGLASHARDIGASLAGRLLARGAREIMARVGVPV